MTEIIHPEQIHFMIEKGRRDSARIAEKILAVLKNEIVDRTIKVDGEDVHLKLFIDIRKDDQTEKPEFAFDAKGTFGHIEFFIKQTGWGS